ncbi:MAG: hypothetical protein ACXWPM_09615 [Bdellovibrionota bacterium]
MNLQLQERDKKILADCYEQKFLRVRHLLEGPFNQVHPSEAYRRIQELERSGYIRRAPAFEGSPERVIRVTGTGAAIAREMTPWDLPVQARINPATYGHDSLVTSVRYRLERLWNGRWVPEQQLKISQSETVFEGTLIGDGRFVFPSGKEVVVELENSHKSWERLQDIRSKSYSGRRSGVLYVTTDPSIYKRILKLLEGSDPEQVFFLISFEDLFRDPPPPTWTIRGPFDLFSRREY